MAQNFLPRSSIKSLTIYIHLSRNLHEVSFPPEDLQLTKDFKKAPFKLEEQGWGEFDMTIGLHYAEKGGQTTIHHDLNFQAPKYENTHVLVFSISLHTLISFCRSLPNLPLVFSRS
jgi:hypothetical protein